jgi:hypothetical protein
MQIQLKANGLFRMTLFLSFILKQPEVGCLIYYMKRSPKCELPPGAAGRADQKMGAKNVAFFGEKVLDIL